MTNEEIARAVDEVLRGELKRAGYDHSEITSGLDHEDEPALFITAHLTDSTRRSEGALYSRAHVRLRERLSELGENRFPYLNFQFKDDLKPLETTSSIYDDGQ